MSLELERTYESLLFRNELPVNWRPYAFRTEANLREFLKDLGSRVDFYNKWIREEHQNHFWLKAFYMPQAFLTAIKLNYARKQQGASILNAEEINCIQSSFIKVSCRMNWTCQTARTRIYPR